MAPPNLKDPAERAAYARELQGVARGVRLAGLWLAAAALALLAARRFGWFDAPLWIVFTVLGLGAMLIITGIAARTRYHSLRMRG
ncbi:MAG: hypothetical protein KF730_16595 [Sphingomonas sp.]|uniref:hypothetical protein n=1 Tax=Sphingomonas sp. TaxID=28214 RepID=UPI0025EC1F2A|nr:hypothetical protein [Sphingomonas sp.]MBX3566180.1 hypothetical protein [Sphingomonas sp.]